MSRTIAVLALSISVLSLAACAARPEYTDHAQPTRELIYYEKIQHWFALQRRVEPMTAEEVNLELQLNGRPANLDEIFYVALLNQQLDIYGHWTLARDKFRGLRKSEELTDQQRQLAHVLERYNQTRINWYQKYQSLEVETRSLEEEQQSLQDQLTAAEVEKVSLEQKIQALTELETSISTRRE